MNPPHEMRHAQKGASGSTLACFVTFIGYDKWKCSKWGVFLSCPHPLATQEQHRLETPISTWIAPHRDKHLQNSNVIWTCMFLERQKMSCAQAGTGFLFPSFHHAIHPPHSCVREHHKSRSSETRGQLRTWVLS